MKRIAIKIGQNSKYSSERLAYKTHLYSLLNKNNLKSLSLNQLFFLLGSSLVSFSRSASDSSLRLGRFITFEFDNEKEAISMEISRRLHELDIVFYDPHITANENIQVFRNGVFQYGKKISLSLISDELSSLNNEFNDSEAGILDFSLKDEIKNPCIERMRVLDYWINELVSAKSAPGPEEPQKALDAGLPFEICAYATKNPDLLRVNKVFPSTFERFYSDMNFINKKKKGHHRWPLRQSTH